MTKGFASADDLAERPVRFDEIGPGLYAFTAGGDPNSGVIVGDDSVMVIEAQATPALARKVVAALREVTDKPVSHLVLTHYHAVRVLGAAAYGAGQVIMSETARAMVAERGQEDRESEFARFPRLFKGHDEIAGLTWPTTTFSGRMTVYLGRRRVEIFTPGRAHTAGDAAVWVPDSGVLFAGDIVEHRSACYCGDGHFADWGATLDRLGTFCPDALLPGRGAAVLGEAQVVEAIETTRAFLDATYRPAARVAARGGSLRDAWEAVRAECDPLFSDFAIYEHCLPFNVARAHDEARGIDTPRIWTPARDRALWAALHGEGG